MEALKIWQEKILPSIITAILIGAVGFVISAKVLAARVDNIEANQKKEFLDLEHHIELKADQDVVNMIYEQVKESDKKLDELLINKKKADY